MLLTTCRAPSLPTHLARSIAHQELVIVSLHLYVDCNTKHTIKTCAAKSTAPAGEFHQGCSENLTIIMAGYIKYVKSTSKPAFSNADFENRILPAVENERLLIQRQLF